MAALFVLILSFLILFCGCSTKKETVYTHSVDTIISWQRDTVVRSSVDTIYEKKFLTIYDTIREQTVKVVTLRESGDTLREVTNNNYYHNIYRTDSIDVYRAKIDSLSSQLNLALMKIHALDAEKKVVKQKKGLSYYMPYIVMIIIFGLIIWALYKYFFGK